MSAIPLPSIRIAVTCSKCGALLYHHVGSFWGEVQGETRLELVVATGEHECRDKEGGDA